MTEAPPLFQEKTRFPKFLFAIAILPFLIAMISASKPSEITETIQYPIIVTVITSVLLYVFSLEVAVYTNRITFRFFPLILKYKEIPTNEITKASILKIRPLIDFGGWGIRYGRKGKAYTVRGRHVLALKLVNGNRLFLGISNIQDAQTALDKLNIPPFPSDEL